MLYFSRWKTVLIWAVVLAGLILALPNVFTQDQLVNLPDWLPKKQLALGLDLEGGSRIGLQVDKDHLPDTDATIAVLSRRLSELGYINPHVVSQRNGRVLVEVPGLYDSQLLKDILSLTGELSFQMVDPSVPVQQAIDGAPPEGDEVVYSFDDPPVAYLVKKEPLVSNKNFVDAQAGIDTATQQPVITFRLDSIGADRFSKATKAGVGQSFAIVLDNQVLSAPVISEAIPGNTGQISGNFDLSGASNLALVMRAGALPTDVTVIEERTIGTDLGAAAVVSGKIAAIIGAGLVILFMLLTYGFLGVIASIALVVNVILILAVLTLFGAPLTLAGVAGIVLTIGMAVDSNVLIYERIREDRRAGFSVIQAIDSGFSRALATIVDANVTTLIAALVLFILGSGPVHGFALTVTIGIVTTLFTTFTLTRWLISVWVQRSKPKEVPRAPLKLVPNDTEIPFMKLRGLTLGFSALSSIAAIALFAIVGMNFGIDFKGGTMVEIQSHEGAIDLDDVYSRLDELNIGEVKIEPFKSDDRALITVGSQGEGENAEQTVGVKIRGELQDDYDFRRVDVIGPSVSSGLSQAGALAVALSLIAIFVYVWFRFEWHFALGAILATIHDVVLLLGMFVLFQMEFNLWSIAALLAIVGYSLNDTVVIYDRVRENLRRHGSGMSLSAILDASINQTLSRTILTSLATFLALIVLYVYGGDDVRSFALILAVGIVVATYSSIFVAGPLLMLFGLKGHDVIDNGSTAAVSEQNGV
ncbi:protein translocase subunit SecD [Phyllobacterium sophorae]|jgi:SecD/SecF fusion protein|uniref:Multifunctional fusion protein n=2 Tax=Phyllobacterium TaxID=28100 RepID=A0A2P7BIF8_9HYPH|nr:protein translocase subunit SecD [Phyllobacterium sophorae]PSH66260.1 protein translocase subunit SecDF [Phyllobacterium sophorae]